MKLKVKNIIIFVGFLIFFILIGLVISRVGHKKKTQLKVADQIAAEDMRIFEYEKKEVFIDPNNDPIAPRQKKKEITIITPETKEQKPFYDKTGSDVILVQ